MLQHRHVPPHPRRDRGVDPCRSPADAIAHLGHHMPPGVGDQGMAVDLAGGATFLIRTPACRRHDPALRLDGADLEHRLPMVPPRLQGEVAGHEDDLGARSSQRQVLLAEAHVVADGQAQRGAVHHTRHERIARAVQRALAVAGAVRPGDIEEMDLAVARDLGARGVEHHRGVEQLVRSKLDDAAAMHGHPLAGDLPHELIGRAALAAGLRQQLGRPLPCLPPTTQIGPGFRQAHHIGPIRRQRRLDQPARLIDVPGLVAALVHLNDTDAHLPPRLRLA